MSLQKLPYKFLFDVFQSPSSNGLYHKTFLRYFAMDSIKKARHLRPLLFPTDDDAYYRRSNQKNTKRKGTEDHRIFNFSHVV